MTEPTQGNARDQIDARLADAVSKVAASIELHDKAPRDDHAWQSRCLMRVLDHCRELSKAYEAKLRHVARHRNAEANRDD